MVDFQPLLKILSVPRPNGSPAERQTAEQLKIWLREHGVAFHVHTFQLYPFFFEWIGLWTILTRSALALSVIFKWGWASLPIALLGLIGGTLDVAFNQPIITWPGARRGENILIEFSPPSPQREVVLSAHYDTKTELLDHAQRMFLLKSLRLGIFLTLLLGFVGPLEAWLRAQNSAWAGPVYLTSALLAVLLVALAWALGLNLSTGRFIPQSTGAVDNGSACAVLLALADRLQRGEPPLKTTRVTLALFTGEEVKMQGSLAYVRDRRWTLPAVALNLEILAQDGDYVVWERDGNVFKLAPTSEAVNQAACGAVEAVTGKKPVFGGPVNSDGSSFIWAGIPTGVLGTYDRRLKDRGFHRPSDNLSRLVPARLPEGVEILSQFLTYCDRGVLQQEGMQEPSHQKRGFGFG